MPQAPAVVVFLIVQRVDIGCSEQELVAWEALARRDSANVLGLYRFFRINRVGGADGTQCSIEFHATRCTCTTREPCSGVKASVDKALIAECSTLQW